MSSLTLITIELLIIFFLSKRLTTILYTIFVHVFNSKRISIAFLSFIYLPGTAIHELAHLIVAEILRVPTGKISFTPQKEEDQEIQLGSLEIGSTDLVRRYLIGFAPLFVGTFFLSLLVWLLQHFWPQLTTWPPKLVLIGVIGYLLFSLSNNMFSSRKDLEGFIFVVPALVILFAAFYLVGIRITLTGKALEIYQQISSGLSKALGIVIGVNFLILLVNSTLLHGIFRLKQK